MVIKESMQEAIKRDYECNTTEFQYWLSSISIILMSFEPFFSHVCYVFIGTKCIPEIR